jgi:transposase
MDLTDKQWALIEPLFETKRRADGRGRPWRDPRDVLNGVLWVLRTGAPWKDLPDRCSWQMLVEHAAWSFVTSAALIMT